MTITIKTLEKYLGNPASDLLKDEPFKNWLFNKSYENDLDEPIIDYVFPQNGMDFSCDENEIINTIFLHSDNDRCFNEGLLDVPFSLNREQVIDRLGSPSKSGDRITHPILGEFGAWDRFARPDYSIHIEYKVNVDLVKRITLMRADVVP
jgi:hypothetical protein